jgi:transposase
MIGVMGRSRMDRVREGMMDTIVDVAKREAKVGRRWPDAVKRRIVAETHAPGASVSVVVRRHDVNANQVFTWRRQYREGLLGGEDSTAAMVPVRIGTAPAGGRPSNGEPAPVRPGLIEIALPDGCRVRVDREVDAGALRRVLEALGRSSGSTRG